METRENSEKVLIVIVEFKKLVTDWAAQEVYGEMKELVAACGGEVVDYFVCRLAKASAKFLIGEGKVQEIVDFCGTCDVDTVIFSYDLKGNQQRNLEDQIKAKTIDRTQLILDIFARHATSKEGKMQVELAQLEYLFPRLGGKGVELSRLGGGIGTLGPGETKLEVDRRHIKKRIDKLKKGLSETAFDRALKRKKRKDKGVPTVSLVGYTNAGKSTLLNALTQAGQITHDGLFTTLDSLSRQLILPNHQKVILSDTVGFIHELPHHLIEAFKATLEEVTGADLLIHVVDASHPHFLHLKDSVMKVLKELDASDKSIITVFNKADKVEDKTWLKSLEGAFKNSVCISAVKKENFIVLLEKISHHLLSLVTEIDVDIPIKRMDLVNLAHKEGEVYSVKYYNDNMNLRAVVPTAITGQFYKAQQNLK